MGVPGSRLAPAAGLLMSTNGGECGGGSNWTLNDLVVFAVCPFSSVAVRVMVRGPKVVKVACSWHPVAGNAVSPALLLVHCSALQGSFPLWFGSLASPAIVYGTLRRRNARRPGAVILGVGGRLTAV